MTLLLLEALIILICAVGIGYMMRWDTARTAARRARHEAALRELGLEVEGDPLDSFVARGQYSDVFIDLASRTSRRPPGSAQEYRTVGVLSFPLALPDMVVCSLAEKEAIMGPLPAVPRSLTGHDRFDAAYAVYVSPELPVADTDFRTAPRGAPSSWARPGLLEQLLEARVHWIRVENQQCSVVLPLVDAENVEAALSVGSNFALAASGRLLLPKVSWRVPHRAASDIAPLWTGALWIGGATLVGTMPVAFLPWVRAVTEDWVCGAGSHILIEVNSEGNYWLVCSGSPNTSLFLHYLTAAGLIMATSLCAALVVLLRREARSSR